MYSFTPIVLLLCSELSAIFVYSHHGHHLSKKKKNESNTGLLHYVRVCVCPTELRSENVIETCFKKH